MLSLLQLLLPLVVAVKLAPVSADKRAVSATPYVLEPFMFTSQASNLQRLLDIYYPLLVSKLFSKSLPRSDNSPSLFQ